MSKLAIFGGSKVINPLPAYKSIKRKTTGNGSYGSRLISEFYEIGVIIF